MRVFTFQLHYVKYNVCVKYISNIFTCAFRLDIKFLKCLYVIFKWFTGRAADTCHLPQEVSLTVALRATELFRRLRTKAFLLNKVTYQSQQPSPGGQTSRHALTLQRCSRIKITLVKSQRSRGPRTEPYRNSEIRITNIFYLLILSCTYRFGKVFVDC